MVTEAMFQKGKRLLSSGCVTVLEVADGRIVARVAGDHGEYDVTKTPGDRFRCSCPSLKWRCSHVVALELVTGRARRMPES